MMSSSWQLIPCRRVMTPLRLLRPRYSQTVNPNLGWYKFEKRPGCSRSEWLKRPYSTLIARLE
jgi:hypothetical protein